MGTTWSPLWGHPGYGDTPGMGTPLLCSPQVRPTGDGGSATPRTSSGCGEGPTGCLGGPLRGPPGGGGCIRPPPLPVGLSAGTPTVGDTRCWGHSLLGTAGTMYGNVKPSPGQTRVPGTGGGEGRSTLGQGSGGQGHQPHCPPGHCGGHIPPMSPPGLLVLGTSLRGCRGVGGGWHLERFPQPGDRPQGGR